MKRIGNLYAQIADTENLQLAFWKAARGKRDRKEVITFSRDLEDNIQILRKQILHHRLRLGDCRFFEIHDPKTRHICAASFPERVLHHAIMNVCEGTLDRYAIFDSYACRKGKGNRRAVFRAQDFARKNEWYLQLDIRKYFDSIDHSILLSLLQKRFKDRQLLGLFERLFATYCTKPGKGLPIGSLISQHMANFYLGSFDHWIKESCQFRHYLRYMDDFILFNPHKRVLKTELVRIREWLAEKLRLKIKDEIRLNRTNCGMTFLGFRILPGEIRLSARSKKRFSRKFKQYQQNYFAGSWTEKDLIRHMEPLLDFTRIAHADAYRRSVIKFQGSAQGLEPREPRRLVEQQPEERAGG